ncbi:hypothetical protein ACIQVL_31875 [Streptomyces sp. NPDC090499]|uniref:hypothetical protein n=1 Tax=Streptomyces sp. NPDC090499 TaxID=3365965 RepID=UPI0038056F11
MPGRDCLSTDIGMLGDDPALRLWAVAVLAVAILGSGAAAPWRPASADRAGGRPCHWAR